MRILAIDSGTTATRAWVVDDGAVVARERALGGARDVARGRPREWLVARIAEVAARVVERSGGWEPVTGALAFGMLTSEHGVAEVPHLTAPVTPAQLASSLQAGPAGVVPVPLLLVPGVVCTDPDDVARSDFMRGEETEIAAVVGRRPLGDGFLYVSPGSHTKFITVDESGSITWCVTSLTGELLWALSQETLLAGLVTTAVDVPDLEAARRGAAVTHEQGLTRALYTTRLQHRLAGLPAEACASYVLGSVVASDLVAIEAARDRGITVPGEVVVKGTAGLANVYGALLEQRPWVTSVEPLDIEPGPLGAWSVLRLAQDGRAQVWADETQETTS